MSARILPPYSPEYIAAVEHIARTDRTTNPVGTFDRQGRWYPSAREHCPECSRIRSPSARWPYSLMTHCRTLQHVAGIMGADLTIARYWVDEIRKPGCHRLAQLVRNRRAQVRREQESLARRSVYDDTVTRLDLARCPYCSQRIQGVSADGLAPITSRKCTTCSVLYHADCAGDIGEQCGIMGCRGRLAIDISGHPLLAITAASLRVQAEKYMAHGETESERHAASVARWGIK